MVARKGFCHCSSTAQTLRLASAAGLSGVTGTSFGNARVPALYLPGHCLVASGQHTVTNHNSAEAIRIFGCQSQTQQCPPVLAHQCDVTQIKLLKEGLQPVYVALVAVVVDVDGFIRLAKAD